MDRGLPSAALMNWASGKLCVSPRELAVIGYAAAHRHVPTLEVEGKQRQAPLKLALYRDTRSCSGIVGWLFFLPLTRRPVFFGNVGQQHRVMRLGEKASATLGFFVSLYRGSFVLAALVLGEFHFLLFEEKGYCGSARQVVLGRINEVDYFGGEIGKGGYFCYLRA